MIKKYKTRLLLIADSKLARLYLAEGFKVKNLIKEFNIEDLEIHHNRQERKTGRFHKSSGSGPRFFDPPSDPKELDRRDFCKMITQYLLNALLDEHYDQLILVCGSRMLGDFRSEFGTKFKDTDVVEFGKELVNYNNQTIEEEILNELRFK